MKKQEKISAKMHKFRKKKEYKKGLLQFLRFFEAINSYPAPDVKIIAPQAH